MTPSVTVLGDSLTVDANEDPRGLWPANYYIWATPGVSLYDVMARVRSVAENPPDVTVLAFGSNDVVQQRDDMHETQCKAADILEDAGSTVVFTQVKNYGVTPFYNPDWDEWADVWNCLLDADGRNIANWTNGLSPSWFVADGLHHTYTGRYSYVRRVTNAVKAVL